MSNGTNTNLDPYTKNAVNNDITPQEKIDGLKDIIKTVKTAMLTTRDLNGYLHSRAMTPASPYSATDLTLVFLANNVSHKFEELENDKHVNVSFYDEKTTSWASFAGTAQVTEDRELIKQHWSKLNAAWFGDLGDGIHKGDENDPRVSAIVVTPEEIKYWAATKNSLVRGAEIAYGAVSGKASTPGELRIITKNEIQLTQGLHSK